MKPPMQNTSAPEMAATTEPERLPLSRQNGLVSMGGWEIESSLLAIFEERARKLAIPIRQHDDPIASRKVLVFWLGTERFAIDSQFIVEVHTAAPVTPIPGTAVWWRGLVNLRGRLYSVLELGSWLAHKGLHTSTNAADNQGELVLVRAAQQTMALVVDKVQAVRQLTAAEIRPPVASEQESEHPSVLGMTDDLIVLLDAEAIFCEVRRQAQSTNLTA